MYCTAAVESTVILLGASTSTASLGPGTSPPGHGAFGVVEDQLPLPAATISAARLVEAQSKADRRVKILRLCFVFIETFAGNLWLSGLPVRAGLDPRHLAQRAI